MKPIFPQSRTNENGGEGSRAGDERDLSRGNDNGGEVPSASDGRVRSRRNDNINGGEGSSAGEQRERSRSPVDRAAVNQVASDADTDRGGNGG